MKTLDLKERLGLEEPFSLTEELDLEKGIGITRDGFLGGRLTLVQPRLGYRAGVDPVLLAASVPQTQGLVLDLGCGVGTALFCYGVRVPKAQLFGLEQNHTIIAMAQQNALQNNLDERTTLIEGNFLNRKALEADLPANQFSQVMLNPPYCAQNQGVVSPNCLRNQANIEAEATLEDWLDFALRCLRYKGGLNLIHRADRLHEILGFLKGRAGNIKIIPLWPFKGKEAKRVIVQAQKGLKGGCHLTQGIVLHEGQERYSKALIAITRQGEPLIV